jgi:hypothetical protein
MAGVSGMTLLAIVVVAAVAPATANADGGAVVHRTRTVVSGEHLRSAAKDGKQAAVRDAARSRFVSDQARAARVVDIAATTAAVTDGLTVVWENGISVDQVSLDTTTSDEGKTGGEGLGVQTTPASAGAATRGVTTGAGLESPISITGGAFQGGGCTTTTSGTGNKLTACWQIYKATNEGNTTFDYYYYDRWATANGVVTPWYDPNNWDATYIDIRSRPWKSVASRIAGLVDYQPRNAITNCVGSGGLGLSYAGLSASIPIQECDDTFPYPDATSKTMRVVYDQGAIFSGTIHGADFAMMVSSWQGQTAVLADYNYAKFCHGTYLSCDGVARNDSGW